MKSRSVVIGLVACLVSFGVALAAFLGLASSNAKRPHVHVHFGQAFAGSHVAGRPAAAEFAGKGCTIVWTGNAGNKDWHTVGNWAPTRLPGRDDVACIPAGKTVVIKHDVDVKGFINHGNLTLAGGNVNFGSGESG